MKGLVSEMNSKDIYLAVQENVITNIVDTTKCLRVDPNKLDGLNIIWVMLGNQIC